MTAVATFSRSQAVRRVQSGSQRSPQPASGTQLVSLAMGEPAFDTPPAVRLAAHAAIECGHTHYAHPQGDAELRDAIANQLSGIGAVAFSADGVLVTHGGTGGLAAAILAIVNPGDVVVLPDPTYSLYADLIHLAGGRCIRVPLQADLHWDLAALAEALAGAKLFVFCNPSNPTGIVHRRDELDSLAEMTARTGIIVLSDEAYSELVYTDEPFISALAVSDLAERTVYCLSLTVPDGAFYAFPRYDAPIPAVDVVAHLRAQRLAVRPGSEFGPAGEHHLRLSFAADRESISTGIERLRTGLADLTQLQEASA